MKKVAVVTVVHRFSLNYLEDYLFSLANQNFKDFDLILFSQLIPEDHLLKYLQNFNRLNIEVVYSTHENIPELRQYINNFMIKSDYEYCIFMDSDDVFFQKNYIEMLLDSLKKGKDDIVFSNVNLFTGKSIIKNYFTNQVPDNICLEFLLDKNCIGFGNSALSVDIIDRFLFPKEIIAVDWWFYTNILSKGFDAKFVRDATFNYRLHENNIAGFLNLTQENILNQLDIKIIHYKNLRNLDTIFSRIYERYKLLKKNIDEDPTFRMQYITYVLNKYKNRKYLWWEPAELW